MSERAAYSRVYWSIVDDPKFVSVYDDDHHLAGWLRLLLIADQAHPASAHLPANVRRATIRVLADVELIDLLPGARYRVHGLDAERERRRLAATSRPGKGTEPPPNGPQTGTERSPNGSGTTGLRRDETRQAETRRDDARGTDRYDEPEGEAVTWLARHGVVLQPHSGYYQKLVVAVERHGVNALVGMFDRLARAGTPNGDTKGFLFKAIDYLDEQKRPDLRALEAEDRGEERSDDLARRVERTKLNAHELGQHQEPNPGCPKCREGAA